MKPDPQSYETAKQTIDAHNQLVAALGPGTAINASMFSASSAALSVGATSGTVKRGKFTVSVGNQVVPNSSVTLRFPPNTFGAAPYAQLTRNGGNGQSPYTYTESTQALVLTLATPAPGETYTFQYAIRD